MDKLRIFLASIPDNIPSTKIIQWLREDFVPFVFTKLPEGQVRMQQSNMLFKGIEIVTSSGRNEQAAKISSYALTVSLLPKEIALCQSFQVQQDIFPTWPGQLLTLSIPFNLVSVKKDTQVQSVCFIINTMMIPKPHTFYMDRCSAVSRI